MRRILIKNGYMIDPASGTDGEYDILIREDKIAKIEPKGAFLQEEEKMQIIDARGLIVAPGLVDVHVHFRDPGYLYKEDIASGASAAAAGGFTTVVMMANTNPCIDNEETLSYALKKGRKTQIRVESCACVTKGLAGKELVPMKELVQAGAAGFTDDGIPILEEELVRKAMKQAAALGVPISFHEEDKRMIEQNGIHKGKISSLLGIGGAPREAEIELIKRDLELALETGVTMNIQHISTKEGVALVREAKSRAKGTGCRIYAEATPQHFTLTQDAVLKYGTLAKVNPPLREEEDRQAILEGLSDGTIDLIATDHAPHSTEEKKQEFTKAPSGLIGLETALPLAITQLVETGVLSMKQLMEKMSLQPAEMYGLDAGYLKEGGPADLVLFDPKRKQHVRTRCSKARNTPFEGWELNGMVQTVICKGKVVWNKENI